MPESSSQSQSTSIFFSVAEQSADEHAAALWKQFLAQHPSARADGLTGPALKSAGAGCFHDMTAKSAMAAAAFARVPEALRLLKRLKQHLRETHYDAAVMVDSPALNLPVARVCRRAGIPVLYYIAPQTWAWGWSWYRNRRLKARASRVACIWPFEVGPFRKAGIEAHYVGHPSFDRLLQLKVDEQRIAELKGDAAPVVTLLPGSREHVIHEVLPGQLDVARSIAIAHRRARFILVAANDAARSQIEPVIAASRSKLRVTVVQGDLDRGAAIRAADLVLCASGTVTLDVMFHGTPMIVMYNTAKWPYQLVGRWLITTPFLSLPNILAGREIVPEFMPYYRSTDPIIARAIEWLATPATLQRVRADLLATIEPLAMGGSAARAAAQLEALLSSRPATGS